MTRVRNASIFQREFLKPGYWPIWLGVGLIRAVCLLPLGVCLRIGSGLGLLAWMLAGKRRNIAHTNLTLCFPELSKGAIRKLLINNFRSSGVSIIETALVWFVPPAKFAHLVDIEGLENLRAAQAKGRGVLLLGMHLSTLDFCGAVLGVHQPFDVMYRRNKNKLFEAIMTRGREANFGVAIERGDVRRVIRRLKEGAIVWYGPDQDYGRRHSIFAPFFTQQAATITATTRIVKLTNSPVIVFSHYRDLSRGRYRIHLSEALEDFPGKTELEDCSRTNAIIESAIKVAPAQYWWLHRRFKTQPDGKPRPYTG